MLSANIVVQNAIDLKDKLEKFKGESKDFNLAICFASPGFDTALLTSIFNQFHIQFIGTSSGGEIGNDSIYTNHCSILLLKIDPQHFRIIEKKTSGNDYTEAAIEIGKEAVSLFNQPGIIVYAAGIGLNGDSVVDGLNKGVEHIFPIFGGIASDYMKFEDLKVFSNSGEMKNGLVTIILNQDHIQLSGISFSGWDEIGKLHQVTKAVGNVLFEIDGEPALKLFNRYFENMDYYAKDDAPTLFTIPALYPLKVKGNDGFEYLRAIILFDFENQALVLGGGIVEGQSFRFCPSPDIETIDITVNQFKNYAKNHLHFDALVINTCLSRQFAFGPMLRDEIKKIYEIWNKPLAGFLALGEIGAAVDDGVSRFHNVTCSLFALTEK